jgi:hypothetical protein
MRFRYKFLGLGSVAVILLLLVSDPDSKIVQHLPFGSGTVSILVNLVISILYIGILHLGRKALMDYIDLEDFFKQALKTPEGSGQAIIGVGLFSVAIAIVVFAATR